MEKSIILSLAERYMEKIPMSSNKNYTENYEKMIELVEKLCKDMPEEEKIKIHNEIFLACGLAMVETEDEYFKEGFKLGLRLAIQNLID